MIHGSSIGSRHFGTGQGIDPVPVEKCGIRPDAFNHRDSWLHPVEGFDLKLHFASLIADPNPLPLRKPHFLTILRIQFHLGSGEFLAGDFKLRDCLLYTSDAADDL